MENQWIMASQNRQGKNTVKMTAVSEQTESIWGIT